MNKEKLSNISVGQGFMYNNTYFTKVEDGVLFRKASRTTFNGKYIHRFLLNREVEVFSCE